MNRIGRIWIGLAAIALGGCVNVTVPEEINIGTPAGSYGTNGDSNEPDQVSKSQAYDIAKDLAEDAGARLSDYDIHDKSVNNVRYVLFEGRYAGRDNDWKRFFSVRVLPTGQATLLRPAEKTLGVSLRATDTLPDLEDDEAKSFANTLLRELRLTPGDYDVKDKEINGNRWVLYERTHPSPDLDWKNGFAVRVAKKDRTATLTR